MTHPMPSRSLAAISIAAFLAAAASAPGLAQKPKFKAVSVKTPDGLTISQQDITSIKFGGVSASPNSYPFLRRRSFR